jgi:uncharacterized RDD family membrane protein YckC
VKHTFNTSVGAIEIMVDERSKVVSIYRFDERHRAVAAAMESWDHVDLVDVLNRQAGMPLSEAQRIAVTLWNQHGTSRSLADRLDERRRVDGGWRAPENAGVALRFVAVLLDAVIVLFPLAVVVGLMVGDGYAVRGDGYASAGINFSDRTFWLVVVLGLGYYVACEAAAGATLGKRMVGIRVVSEDGAHVSVRAAVVRNLLRIIDALFFYLVAFVSALLSTRGQRLGDRAAHTVVVRR